MWMWMRMWMGWDVLGVWCDWYLCVSCCIARWPHTHTHTHTPYMLVHSQHEYISAIYPETVPSLMIHALRQKISHFLPPPPLQLMVFKSIKIKSTQWGHKYIIFTCVLWYISWSAVKCGWWHAYCRARPIRSPISVVPRAHTWCWLAYRLFHPLLVCGRRRGRVPCQRDGMGWYWVIQWDILPNHGIRWGWNMNGILMECDVMWMAYQSDAYVMWMGWIVEH